MSAIQPSVFFGEIPADRTHLQKDWQGRQISWIALSDNCHWVISEGLSFATLRTAAAVAEVFIPPLQVLFLQKLSLGNALCLYSGHKIAERVNLQNRVQGVLNRAADYYAVHQLWMCVFEATSLEMDVSTRNGLFQSMHAPLALSPKTLSVYLNPSQIGIKQIPLEERWFEQLLDRTPFFKRDLKNFRKSHQSATLSTKISRDAWAFAIHVEEAALLLQSSKLSIKVDPMLHKLTTKGLGVTVKRFNALYSKCVPSHLKNNYPKLTKQLQSLLDNATQKCTEEVLFFAANELIKPHHNNPGEKEQLAYLYRLAFTNEIDSLFDIEDGDKTIACKKNDLKNLSEVLSAFDKLHPLQLFFEYAESKIFSDFNELLHLYNEVKENYEILDSSINDGMDSNKQEITNKLNQFTANNEWELLL